MRVRAGLIAAGVVVMSYAVAGALADPQLRPAGVLLFLAGVLIAHDLLWMPIVLLTGAALTRLVPRRHRPAARGAAISAAAVTVVAVPLVLGFGRPADNASALPLPYGRNLLLVLLVILGATLLSRLRRRRARRGRKDFARPGPGGPDAADG